jgi:hypothetical protein
MPSTSRRRSTPSNARTASSGMAPMRRHPGNRKRDSRRYGRCHWHTPHSSVTIALAN